MDITDARLDSFINANKLSADYLKEAKKWFDKMMQSLDLHQKSAGNALVVGINGAQGSGKSTLSELMVLLFEQYGLSAITVSMDDFYYTRAERRQLAKRVHPLLQTRGVPGTHDIKLAIDVITKLKSQQSDVAIPRFDKAQDDRQAEKHWPIISKVDIVILEGWCLGAKPQPEAALVMPINRLEEGSDSQGKWRRYVNKQLASHYPKLFNLIDQTVMLKAPDFECIFNWRLEQEKKLEHQYAGQSENHLIMSHDQVFNFIQHYQRITEQLLISLPSQVDHLFLLDKTRKITAYQSGGKEVKHLEQWLVFSDLDGSLLDHYDYSFEVALPMIERLEKMDIPLILNSSKTLAELLLIRPEMQNSHPFIIENGAAVYIPVDYFDEAPQGSELRGEFWVKSFVEQRLHWQQLIREISDQYAGCFKLFSELSTKEIALLTGLNIDDAKASSERQFGEPVVWRGDDKKRIAFITDMEQLGAHVLIGGRFLHVSGECDKGQAMAWLACQYQLDKACRYKSTKTIAIGDSGNDVAMLERADQALIIRSPVHDPPRLKRTTGMNIMDKEGPQGWYQGVKHLLTFIRKEGK
ncbi:MAG: D-glycerate 3-kinase [Methylophagaceae bacterium]|jgi:D-glycerate 3-kinase